MNENNPIEVRGWGFAFPKDIPQSFRNRREILEDFYEFISCEAEVEYSVRGCCRLYGTIYRPGKEPDDKFISLNVSTIKKSGDDYLMEIGKLTIRVKKDDFCSDLKSLLDDLKYDLENPTGYPKLSRQHAHYLRHCRSKYGELKNLL